MVASRVALPVPEIPPREADILYEVDLGRELGPVRTARADDENEPWAVEQWRSEGQSVVFPARATFQFQRDRITLVTEEINDPEHVAHLLVDHVVPRVVALRGDLMLHASGAVGPSGRAHLFLGQAGAGKSTLVTRLGLEGWKLLDDDGVRVARESGGMFLAFPGTPDVRLLPDAATTLLPGQTGGARTSAASSKRRYDATTGGLSVAIAPAPVGALYLLDRDGADTAHLSRLGMGDALSAVTRNAFHAADSPHDLTRFAFDRGSALVAAVGSWRLAGRSGSRSLAAQTSLIRSLDSSFC